MIIGDNDDFIDIYQRNHDDLSVWFLILKANMGAK